MIIAPKKPVKKPNSTPYLSVNKLGEYLVASPRRQRSILHTLKYPKEDGGAWGHVHVEARNAIKSYFENNFDENIILECIEKLEKRAGTDKKKQADSASIELLQKTLESENIEFDNFTYSNYGASGYKMNVKGVTIGITPDLIIESKIKGKEGFGLMMLHLSISSEISDESGKYISCILNKCADELVESKYSNRKECNASYDVNGDKFISCPSSTHNRWKNIEAACETILAIWDTI